MNCFFVSDLHGDTAKYQKLFRKIEQEQPEALFIGGDLLPSYLITPSDPEHFHVDFVNRFLVKNLNKLRDTLGEHYPRVFIILGNDDGRFEEAAILDVATTGLWEYIHGRRLRIGKYPVYGYAYVPPTPFRLKDWERYDVSRFTDPGCIPPEQGAHSHPISDSEVMYSTIADDLTKLVGDDPLDNAIFLFHSPPYQTNMDRAALDGKKIDHAPLDVHVGSIAIRRFIEDRQPLITLHGHIHESARITGSWRDRLGRTHSFTAAHDGPELSIIGFDPEYPEDTERFLL